MVFYFKNEIKKKSGISFLLNPKVRLQNNNRLHYALQHKKNRFLI